MNNEQIQLLLGQVKDGEVSIDEAVETLRHLPFEDISFARIDHHRQIRCGFPEVIYCEGKATEHVVEIFGRLAEKGHNVLGTRAEKDVFEAIAATGKFPAVEYDELGRTILLVQEPMVGSENYIAIVTAGTADIPVAMEAKVTCRAMGQKTKLVCDAGVAGIHRLLGHPETMETMANASVVIVIAGMEGALASVVGGLVDCPVIAVPTSVGYGASFDGLAALLAMLNSCAAGVTVVNIDNGFGAGYAASVINKKLGSS
jgi:NCAIR mutase (PurE)-related protein